MTEVPLEDNNRLSGLTLIILIAEALPIPVCLMGAVFALISPGVLFQIETGTLLVWSVVLYPLIWLAAKRRTREWPVPALTAARLCQYPPALWGTGLALPTMELALAGVSF